MSRATTALPWVLTALLVPLLVAGCGPTMLEKRVIAPPDPARLAPQPTPEEQAGEVPTLLTLQPPLPLVPRGTYAPEAPPDPRPVALKDAPATAPPLPPPPGAAPAGPEGDPMEADDRRDDRRNDRRDRDDEPADDAAEDEGGDDGEDTGRRRGGVRVNPR